VRVTTAYIFTPANNARPLHVSFIGRMYRLRADDVLSFRHDTSGQHFHVLMNEVKMKRTLHFTVLLIVFALFFSFPLWGSITGKIAGTVTDAETGDPLIGFNVLIEGTTMGAATGLDGTYVINNVEPGIYTMVFSGIGYQRKIVTNVSVATNFTTRIDIELAVEAVLFDEVVVEATTPLIRKDLTSSHTVIDNRQIEALPVESIDQILSLQAGITRGAGGELHIRGGRSTEIAYNVNGVSAVNPFDFGRTVQIAPHAIRELSVVSGTFNAEFGNALSGIVNTVTKEGGNKYNGSLSSYSGSYFSPNKDIFLNIDNTKPVDNHVFEATFGGPIPYTRNNITLFLSGRYNKTRGYLYGQRQHTISDSVARDLNNPNIIYLSQTGDNKIVPMNPNEDISATGKLTFKPARAMKISYDMIYSTSEYQLYNHNIKYNPDANYNRYEWGLINSLELRHAISNRTFYSVKFSHSLYDFKRYLFPLLDASGNPVSFQPGMSLDNLHPDPRYQPSHKSTRLTPYTFSSGGTLNEHFYQRSNTGEVRFDVTSQVTNQHDVKLGVQYKWEEMDFQNFMVLRDTVTYREATILPPGTASHDLYNRSPRQFSAYIQDKMEFSSMIVNVGFRLDYFSSRALYAPDDYAPNENLQNAEAKITYSPRLGMSFPITDRGIIHFSYGHFFQLPPYQYLYTNPEFRGLITSSVFGNANLNPERTVSYELGLQQQLSDNIAFNITGFYKDVRDLLALQEIRISTSITYLKYVNKDYGNIKGITFSLTKQRLRGELFYATIDYTFQVAEGNDTDASSFFLDLSSGRQSEKLPVPLAWDQTHTLDGVVSFGGGGSWMITIVGSLSTGLPYTPALFDQDIILSPNSGRKPIRTNVDLLMEKSFNLRFTAITAFLKVYNLFDTLNERFVYNDTGRATYTLEESRGGPQETNRIAERVPGIKPASEYFVRPNYYSAPREVRVGLSLEF
jgi:outer membrane receptor protein involved in Fe transport